MPSYTVYMWLSGGVQLLFVMAFGACVGSLTNVLVYRLPLGLDVVRPASRCPICSTRLTWRENIPIFGWVLLRGRCRFCRCRISPEYPLVELFVAVLFGAFFALWYLVPDGSVWAGIPVGRIKPDWAENGIALTWPAFAVLLLLLGSLVAMTLVDAKTFTIPLVLAWVPTVAAVVIHPLHAAWFEHARGFPGRWWHSSGVEVWTLAHPGLGDWALMGAAVGGCLGLGVSVLLLHLGLIRRSFADYDEWEASVRAKGDGDEGDDPSLWIQYPHARREMLKELAFLGPPVSLALVGAWAARALVVAMYGPYTVDAGLVPRLVAPVEAPLWFAVLSGVLLGYLVGGGVVWAVRVLGSLVFGKEAMGLGDVHLMAAVGACLGWIDPTLAFFGAAFVGVGWALLSLVFSGAFRRALPYGPFLAVSTILVLLTKPGLEVVLTRLLHASPPVNIP